MEETRAKHSVSARLRLQRSEWPAECKRLLLDQISGRVRPPHACRQNKVFSVVEQGGSSSSCLSPGQRLCHPGADLWLALGCFEPAGGTSRSHIAISWLLNAGQPPVEAFTPQGPSGRLADSCGERRTVVMIVLPTPLNNIGTII